MPDKVESGKQEVYNVPDTPFYLARWIWQHYVGIPSADEPPYDKEFTRLLDRIKALAHLCECGHNHAISIHRHCEDIECTCNDFKPFKDGL